MKANKSVYFGVCLLISASAAPVLANTNDIEQKNLDAAREELGILEQKIEKFNLLDELKAELEAIEQKEEALARELDSRKKYLSNLQIKKAVAKTHAERDKAVGERMESLKLVSGKTYEDVEIRKVSDVGITIFHSSGSARIDAKDLPPIFKERFLFDSDRAAAIRNKETMAASAHYSTITPDAAINSLPQKASSNLPQQATEKDEKEVAPKGRLTARIIGYKKGHKEVEFTAFTNCDARVTVYGAIEYPPDYRYSFSTTSGQKTIRNVKVRNDYSASLHSSSGKLLDEEQSRQKSGLGKPRLGD
jgi:hypothetical protein